jgi:hypothetical protein
MSLGFETITDLASGAELLRTRPYGIIEVIDGQFHQVRLRPFPKLVTPWDVFFHGGWYHRNWPGNRCLLYYNQPRAFRNFLALKYVVSARDTTLATFRRSLTVLDEIARLKQSDAILCDAANWRISGRLLTRWGWQSHAPQRWHRNYIKRLYPNETRMSLPLELASTV